MGTISWGSFHGDHFMGTISWGPFHGDHFMGTISLMEKLIIEYKGLILSEPNMLLSNWVITLVCLWGVQRLNKVPASPLISYYRLVFIMNAIGAFLGGLAHLLFYYTGKPFQAFAWIFIGIGTYYLQRIALIFLKKSSLKKPLLIFSTVKLILFIMALLYFQSFFVVLADLALGLFIMVVPIHIKDYTTTKNKGSMWMLVAVGILIVSAIFPVFRISIHPLWFNFNDIGHIFLAMSLFIIYLSARFLAVSAVELKRQESTD